MQVVESTYIIEMTRRAKFTARLGLCRKREREESSNSLATVLAEMTARKPMDEMERRAMASEVHKYTKELELLVAKENIAVTKTRWPVHRPEQKTLVTVSTR